MFQFFTLHCLQLLTRAQNGLFALLMCLAAYSLRFFALSPALGIALYCRVCVFRHPSFGPLLDHHQHKQTHTLEKQWARLRNGAQGKSSTHDERTSNFPPLNQFKEKEKENVWKKKKMILTYHRSGSADDPSHAPAAFAARAVDRCNSDECHRDLIETKKKKENQQMSNFALIKL